MRKLSLSLAAALTATTLLAGSPGLAISEPAGAPAADRSDKDLPVNAQEALARVEEIFSSSAPRGAHRHDADGLDATLALRDLALTKDALPPAERKRAERYLARPTDGGGLFEEKYGAAEETPLCSANVCVHYVLPGNDSTHGATTTFAGHVRTALDTTHAKFVSMGYRAPKSDLAAANNGGNALPDIYLANLGSLGIFGYCAAEEWENLPNPDFDSYGYCVLDNNYTEFGNSQTPLDFMRVTAAHEYFHNVQFAYDALEDGWFMEATATWAEDEVFDSVNDNVAFLFGPRGPMTNPRVSMDHSNGSWYGYWAFYRYLSQKYGASVVRAMWNRADSVGGAADMYSLRATRAAVAARGGNWNDLWRRFADANRRPKLAYPEAKSGDATYPTSKSLASFTLTPTKRSRTPSVTLDHLTSSVFRFKPNRKMKQQRGWKLKVKIDGDRPSRGGAGLATIRSRSGKISRVPFDLDGQGVRTKRLAFGRSVTWVEITVVNASTRFANCWSDNTLPYYSCFGTPRDQNRTYRVAATAIRS